MTHPMDSYFDEQNGALFKFFPGAEVRPGQRRMAEILYDAIEEGSQRRIQWLENGAGSVSPAVVQVLEAGTGVGKSLAYLLSALAGKKRPIVVSTRTKNLQQQLMDEDLPRAANILERPIKGVVVKGRGNYVCKKAWEELQQSPPDTFTIPDQKLWLKMGRWMTQTSQGDGDELGKSDDSPLWELMNARSERCTGRKCAQYESCFLTQLKQQASQADVIIVNHALLLADRQLRESDFGQVIPDAPILILDEAHELTDQITDSCAWSWSTRSMNLLISDLEEAAKHLKDPSQIPLYLPALRKAWADLQESVPSMPKVYALGDEAMDVNSLTLHLQAWQTCMDAMRHECQRLSMQKEKELGWEKLMDRIQYASQCLDQCLMSPEGWVSTLHRESKTFVRFQSNPVNVGDFFDRLLRQGFETVVLTSATLRGDSSFDHLQITLGLSRRECEASESVESPFDFQNQGLIFVPPGIPDRRASATQVGEEIWLTHCQNSIERLCRASRGRAMILFTSRKMLEYFSPRLQVALPALTFFIQGQHQNRQGLLEEFRTTPQAVLLGLASFWQGVDLPGDSLVLVVVMALPFAPPDDPILQARMARLNEEDTLAGFTQLQVPLMALKLKQGMGRLIRTQKDRGVVAIMDPRILMPHEDPKGKSYARIVRASLPPFPVVREWETVETFLSSL